MDNANKASLSQQSRLLQMLIKYFPEGHSYNDSPQWRFTETLTKRHASELISEVYEGKTERLGAEFKQFINQEKNQRT